MKDFTIKNKNIIKNTINKIMVLLFWILIWQLLYCFVNKEVLIPSPMAVFKTFFLLLSEYQFWTIVFSSAIRIILGFLCALIFGVVIAALTYRFRIINDILSPILNIIKTTPVASFIILALVWIPSGMIPNFISFLMVLPLVWVNIKNGFENIDRELLEMANVFKVPKKKQFTKIVVPSIMPYFAASCNVGMGFAWKSGIAAEVIANTRLSIGSMIYQSKIYLETSALFAWTIVVILLSLVLETVIRKIMNRFLIKI